MNRKLSYNLCNRLFDLKSIFSLYQGATQESMSQSVEVQPMRDGSQQLHASASVSSPSFVQTDDFSSTESE